jgi:hypothetical protein
MKYIDLNSLAVDLVASIPDFAGRSASPYQAIWQEGDPYQSVWQPNHDVFLLCADGRKFCFTPEQVNRVMIYSHLPDHRLVVSAEGSKNKSLTKPSSRRGRK